MNFFSSVRYIKKEILMEITTHFKEIKQIILTELESATTEIIVAVAWFTNHDIFKILVDKADKIDVRLLVLNDDINNRTDGLNFQHFIDLGGKFYYGYQENPMHNKYCIVDNKVLITGSYNYTYLAEYINDENVIKITGACDLILDYKKNFFDNLIYGKKEISSIKDYLINNPYQKNMFSFNSYGLKDIYQHTFQLEKTGRKDAATKIIDQLELNIPITLFNNFVIQDVIYRQWRQDYYADKIQVADGVIVLHFRTTASGGFIYGPQASFCWLLRESADHSNFIKTHRITNIKVNGKTEVIDAEAKTIYHFTSTSQNVDLSQTDHGYDLNDDGVPVDQDANLIPVVNILVTGEFELSCDIHFDSSELQNTTIDLIEGLETDTKDNHWHCFDINMKLNREDYELGARI
jgi:hypothetical protein